MKKFALRLALASLAFIPAASAIAADLDVPPPPPPVEELRPATYDWTGFYAGVWTGATCVEGELTDNGGPTDWEMSGCGWKGGVLGGYNHQFDQWVLGVEGDWGMTSDIAVNNEPGGDFAFSMDQIATLRARMGYAADDTLLYLTGGAAWAKGNLDSTTGVGPDNIKGSHWGWTAGAGIEHAFTDQFHLRLEYLYTRFKGDNYSEACCNVDIHDFDDHEIRAAATWHF